MTNRSRFLNRPRFWGLRWGLLGGLTLAVAQLFTPAGAGTAHAAPVCTTSGSVVTCTYTYTGAAETFTVPADITSVRIVARGAAGAQGHYNNPTDALGGQGGEVSADLAVSPNQSLLLVVGGAPTTGACYTTGVLCIGGFNGGGTSLSGGGGGGASDVRVGGTDLTQRVLVAAGGGGGGAGNYCDGFIFGGNGGNAGSAGSAGQGCRGFDGGGGGQPGSQSAGGAGGTPEGGNGTPGSGGSGGNTGGGGGGGGYYGGGSGGDHVVPPNDGNPTAAGGGGGGSNLVPTGGTARLTTQPAAIIVSYTLPGINVTKTANPAPASVPETGGNVTFDYVVTNNLATAATITALSDSIGPLAGDADCQVGTVLASNASCSFSATFAIPAGDTRRTHVSVSTFTATGQDADGNSDSGTDSETVSYTDVLPDFDIAKTANPAPGRVPETGGNVTFDYVVTNNSGEAAEILSLDDFGVSIGDADCRQGTVLAGHASCTFSATFAIPAGDYPSGYPNNFTALVSDNEGNTAQGVDTEHITYSDVLPDITVTKTANPAPASVPETGGNVTFDYVVTNNSGEAAEINSLADDKFGALAGDTDCRVGTVLAGGASCTFSATFAIPAGEPGRPHESTFTATVSDDEGNRDSGIDSETVTYTNVEPDVTVTKTANPAPGRVPETGGNVSFDFVVTNNSGEAVSISSFLFGEVGDADCRQGTVLAGHASCTFSATLAIPAGNYPSGYPSSFIVLVTDNEGSNVTRTDSEVVSYTDVLPDITVTKTANPAPASVPETGGNVTFDYVVTNNSGEAAKINYLSDNKFGALAGDADCREGTVLAGRASCTFSATFAIPAGDYPGTHESNFVVTVKDDEGNRDIEEESEIVTYTVNPTATATATATPTATPTATATATATPTATATATSTPTLIPTVTPTVTPTATPTATPTGTPGTLVLYASTSRNGQIGTQRFKDEDILVYSAATGWQLLFDGSDVGISKTDIDAFELLADHSILISFDRGLRMPIGDVSNADIVRFIPTGLGVNTSGSFEWYFDGSDVGLTGNSGDIDALALDANGNLLLSVVGAVRLPAVTANDEDLLRFIPTALGSNTAGTLALFFDGSNVGLSAGAEDLFGAGFNAARNALYLNTKGNFNTTSPTTTVAGDNNDIFGCTLTGTGAATACSLFPFFDGAATGLPYPLDDFTVSFTESVVIVAQDAAWDTDDVELVQYELLPAEVTGEIDTEVDEFDRPEAELDQIFFLPLIAQ